MDNNFEKVGLYKHNIDSYKLVRSAYESLEDIVGIVHATGTGKSYNALQLAYDNKDKKIVYVVPSKGIIEHIKKIIEDNPKIDLKKDFSNLEFRTYQSFISLDEEEIASIDCDLLILDEFHHIGAPVWGARINTMIKTHPKIKIFGMTAYTVRDRGTPYERDMANPDTDELFSGKIQSRYDLCDAMIDGVLPKPIYKSAYINLLGSEIKIEKRVQKLNATTKEFKEYMSILSDAKKRIHEAPGILDILRKYIKPDGKYIYFCPPCKEDGVNDIETIKKQAFEWFKQFVNEEDIIFYTSTSDMGDAGKLNRDAFYNDVTLDGNKVDNKLRVMFAINQYNEGIHAPNIDGVIMGRGTTSDIVYFEQLGRALSVRGNTKEMFDELENYSRETLIEMCKKRDILIKVGVTKEELIEKLTAPVIIDLTNNYEFIKELENNLKDRIKSIQSSGIGRHRDIRIRDASFDIEIENQDLFEMLKYVSDRLTMTWEDYYELAKQYYNYHHNLEVPQRFKTNDGYTYDENGTINLGKWIVNQRKRTPQESERGELLSQIGMRFKNKKSTLSWEEMYEYAKKYYEHHQNLEVPARFKTNDGYTYNENGRINLGDWIASQRKRPPQESEQGELLSQIGMRFKNKKSTLSWEEMYEYAKKYYSYHQNLEVLTKFKTNDGYTYDENGAIKLGTWIANQRRTTNKESKRGQLLLQISMRFEKTTLSWEEMYEYAKKYYDYHHDLEIPSNFKTNDGYTKDENGRINLGRWIFNQRNIIPQESERGQLLLQIGMRFENKRSTLSWEEMYEYAKKYYNHHQNLEIPYRFKTNDGYTYDENGTINLGWWIARQRKNTSQESKRGQLLLQIGMRFENKRSTLTWEEMYEYAQKYYDYHQNLVVPNKFKTNDGYIYDENGTINLGNWIAEQRKNTPQESDHGQLLLQIGMIWNIKKNKEEIVNICLQYNIDEKKNKMVLDHISVQELESKIQYLKLHDIPLVNEDGILIDIFSMSSIDMKDKYGASLEELITTYYDKDKDKRKGV